GGRRHHPAAPAPRRGRPPLPRRPHPDGTEPDPTEGRRLVIARHADGSITGRFDLDAVGGEKLQAALESIVQASRPKGDTRTRAQQQADALVQLADNALASGTLPFLRRVKPHVIVTIDLEDLADPARGPGAAGTGFGATLSAARARWLACDAILTRMVLNPDGLPLDVGREQRIVPPHLRKAVERRDRHCVFAGCGAPTVRSRRILHFAKCQAASSTSTWDGAVTAGGWTLASLRPSTSASSARS
ncbi:DUF222 domain-containing protein, partial [Modestobacter marinus]|uniref:DUF222 domain-containing protein n=1 Tax=Modestobacter marinus TaxID=477641 RepID=UPI00279601A8